MENSEGHLIAISGLGVMLVEKGDLDKADEILRLVLKARQETPDRPVWQHIAIISNIGEVAYLREDWKLAVDLPKNGTYPNKSFRISHRGPRLSLPRTKS